MSLYRIGAALEEHPHTCPVCGCRWRHGAENFGDAEAHGCPRCGTTQWMVGASEPTKAEPSGMKYAMPLGMAFLVGTIAWVMNPKRKSGY